MSDKLNIAVKGISLPIAFACVISAVMAIASTAAYLTSSSSDVNIFAMGRVQVELTEDATEDSQEKPDGTTLNFYEITPGAVIAKNPAVTVPADAEPCWVFVKLAESANLDDFIAYQVDEGESAWTQLTDASGNPVAGIWYREVGEDELGRALPVLKDDAVQVASGITWSQLGVLDATVAAGEGSYPTLSITAWAVQRAGIGSAYEAWEHIAG